MTKEIISYFNIEFGPSWKYVRVVRNFVESFISVSLNQNKKTDLYTIAVEELLENGVKYAEGGIITLKIVIYPSHLEIITQNNISKESQERLERLLKETNDGTSLEAYTKKLQAIIDNPSDSHSLGLVRIRHEAEGTLNWKIEGGKAEVTARCPI